ncbi:lactosylceramide 1,3-N-acetyl-beta-D-glucosaminyltransferase-like [Tubulanus polymorphus]|uniref:lactosylceramide 1,3-N-acetyl-beta-D-glucosaminyltransferase-like n=1 Tax=Tubulanus polymorphus TaxID=672921 RepID=UPI003DA35B1D
MVTSGSTFHGKTNAWIADDSGNGINESTVTKKEKEDSTKWTFPQFRYIINTRCSAIHHEYLFVVPSAMAKFYARQRIRQTWAARYNASVVFFLGLNNTEGIANQVRAESDKYKDIVVANYVDSYRNLTLKTMSIIQWLNDESCENVKFVTKTDDDLYVNLPLLKTLLSKLEATRDDKADYIVGRVKRNATPVRDKNSQFYKKWGVSEDEYSGRVYPDYCLGSGYLFPYRTVKKLYDVSRTTKPLFLEDVFLTGIVAEKAGIERINGNCFIFTAFYAYVCELIERACCAVLTQSKQIDLTKCPV